MNPITKSACQSLLEKYLVELQDLVSKYMNDHSSDETKQLLQENITEVEKLFSIIQTEILSDGDPSFSALANEDELALDDESVGGSTEINQDIASNYADQVPDDMGLPGQLSVADSNPTQQEPDDDELAMLTEMEEPKGNEAAVADPNAEMSDEEAMAMLANMDSPTAEADADPNAEMSDEEAMALLANMDGAPPAATSEGASEISDEEAMALLADMDSPSSSAAEPPKDADADDDALALLADLGGTDGGVSTEVAAAPAQAESVANSNPEEDVGEIEEFGDSEFGSDPEMIKDFINNADELMETLDEQILNLEQDPKNTETIEEIFRAAHTLKGAAGMFGYKAIERVMHKMENYFDLIRKKKRVAEPDSIDVILKAMDVLGSLINGVKEGKPSGTKTAPIVSKLIKVCAGTYKGDSGSSSGASDSNAPASGGDGSEGPGEEKAAVPAKKKAENSTIRVDLRRLDLLVNLVGELVIDRTRFMNIEEEIRAKNPQLEVANNMTETVQLFGRHMNEIQDIIMKVRMVPINTTSFH